MRAKRLEAIQQVNGGARVSSCTSRLFLLSLPSIAPILSPEETCSERCVFFCSEEAGLWFNAAIVWRQNADVRSNALPAECSRD